MHLSRKLRCIKELDVLFSKFYLAVTPSPIPAAMSNPTKMTQAAAIAGITAESK